MSAERNEVAEDRWRTLPADNVNRRARLAEILREFFEQAFEAEEGVDGRAADEEIVNRAVDAIVEAVS